MNSLHNYFRYFSPMAEPLTEQKHLRVLNWIMVCSNLETLRQISRPTSSISDNAYRLLWRQLHERA